MRTVLVFFILLQISFAFAGRPQDIVLPKEVLERIKTEYSLNDDKPVRIVFIDMEVLLMGNGLDQKKILGESQRVLDLAGIITHRHKNFTVSIAPKEKIEGTPLLFFMNQYQPVMIGNDMFGLECGKSVVIKKHFSELGSVGVKVSNLSSHYIYVIGGDYLLTYLEGTTLKVGYFKIRDGRLLQKLCRVGA